MTYAAAFSEASRDRILLRLGDIPSGADLLWGKASNRTDTLVVDTNRFDECVLHAVGKRPVCVLTTPDSIESTSEMARVVNPDDQVFRRVAVVLIIGERSRDALAEQTAWGAISDQANESQVAALMRAAFVAAERRLHDWEEVDDFHHRRSLLTPEESEVLVAVCDGKLNKQIAADLGISIRTVEQRRRRVFNKMGVESAIPLARKIGKVEALERHTRRFDSPLEEANGSGEPLNGRQIPTPNGMLGTLTQTPVHD